MKQFKINIFAVCEKCTRRNCRITPDKKGVCTKSIRMREGFPLSEMLNKRSTKL